MSLGVEQSIEFTRAAVRFLFSALWPQREVDDAEDGEDFEAFAVLMARVLRRKEMGWRRVESGKLRWDANVPETPDERAQGEANIAVMVAERKPPAAKGVNWDPTSTMFSLGLDPKNPKHRALAEYVCPTASAWEKVKAARGVEEVSGFEVRNMDSRKPSLPSREEVIAEETTRIKEQVLPHMARTGQLDSKGNVVANAPLVPLPEEQSKAPLNGKAQWQRRIQNGLDPVAGIPLAKMPDPDADEMTPELNPRVRNAFEETELRRMEVEAAQNMPSPQAVQQDVHRTWFEKKFAEATGRSAF